MYGGEGITPDIFVPYDTLTYDRNVMKLLMSGVLNEFVYRNYLDHQKQFDAYKNATDFNKNYTVEESTFQNLTEMVKKDSIHLALNNPSEKAQISRQIKSLTARQIWRSEGFFEINNTYDDVVKKAVELLQPKKEVTAKNRK